MIKLLGKKEKKTEIPQSIKVALEEYRMLMVCGCLVIPCKRCRHLIEIDSHRYTCKREQLINKLMPKYKQEIEKIDEELRK